MSIASKFVLAASVGLTLLTLVTCAGAQDVSQAPKRFEMDAETAARMEKLSKDPFRWIILHSKTPTPKAKEAAEIAVQNAEPRVRPAVEIAKKLPENIAKTEPAKRTAPALAQPVAKTADMSPAVAKTSQSVTVAPVTKAAADKDISLQVGKVVAEVMDFSDVKVKFNGTIEAASGASIFGRPITFSARNPNPVVASLSLDKDKKMARLEYDVPEAAGSFGGAGIKIDVAADGLDLSQLVGGEVVDGLLSMEVDTTVAMTLKVILMGPQQRSDAAYPSFRLPIEPGRRTYGLLLADFAAATWTLGAPGIAETLKNVIGVGVEYTRRSAFSPTDRGVFWVGDIQIHQAKQIAVAGK